jgi:uncharacterized protein
MLFRSVQYSGEPPWRELDEFKPDRVYVLDFCYKEGQMMQLLQKYPDTVTIDHHATSIAVLEAVYGPEGEYIHSTRYAGCVLTWLHFLAYADVPTILQYVQDRDLWLFYLEQSKAVNAYISTLPNDFEVWDTFSLDKAMLVGSALVDFQHQQIKRALKNVSMIPFDPSSLMFNKMETQIDILIPVVNASSNISELGEAMCLSYPDAPFSMSYCDRADGIRSYSLRSNNGFNVSEVAKGYGGGGHPSAAGFSRESPEVI